MTTDAIAEGAPPEAIEKPTRIRNVVLSMMVVVAVLLYLDRFSLSNSEREVKATLGVSDDAMSIILSAFFFSYAFGQIFFGYLADRFGARRMLTAAIVAWSTCTGLMGFAVGFFDMLVYRLLCGLFESGAYPACAAILRRWVPASKRGMASGIVSLGGRIGGAITPKATVLMMGVSAAMLPGISSWRPVFIVFGALGICIAAVFWRVHRDRPDLHPRTNAAERALIAGAEPPLTTATTGGRFWRAVLTNRSLTCCSLVQFGSNFGWAFLFTYLNRYLLEVHRADLQTRGTMCSLVGTISVPAVILGGWMTDAATRRFGKRWGRALPMAIPRFVSAGLYFAVALLSVAWLRPTFAQEAIAATSGLCAMTFSGIDWPIGTALRHLVEPVPSVGESWTLVLMFGMVAFFSDLTLPPVWAFNLDIGGKYTGFVLGWGNMWGNLGAFFSPIVLNQVAVAYGWNAVFWICGFVFLAIAVLSLFVDANETLEA